VYIHRLSIRQLIVYSTLTSSAPSPLSLSLTSLLLLLPFSCVLSIDRQFTLYEQEETLALSFVVLLLILLPVVFGADEGGG